MRLVMCDISCSADASSVMSSGAACWMPPISGIMHAGGILKASHSHLLRIHFLLHIPSTVNASTPADGPSPIDLS